MATSPIKQLTTGQRIMGGIVVFKPKGTNKFIKIGPVGAVTVTPTLEEVESRSDESGTSQKIGNWVVKTDATVNIADIQMWTQTIYEAMFLAVKGYKTQSAVASAVLLVEDVAVGDVIQIPGIKPTVTSVTDGAPSDPVAYLEDVTGFGNGNYIYQRSRGFLEFTAIPEDAGADAKVTYALAAVTEADKIVEYDMMRTSGIRGELQVLGVVDGGLPGDAVDYIFHDVEFRPQGDLGLKDATALNTASLTGTVYNTGGAGYGYVRPVATV
ncbi:hypothetical protein LJR098_001073 [Rhizobium sp. LjRoot98]|uniref:hypothetical protein n=1 Tax=Rhizobium sp. LjRoot98 TaxID=3342345 RepID=UPI003ECD7F5C